MSLILISIEYCADYKSINDEWRKIRNWMPPTDANSDSDNLAMDGNNWFRFLEPAGTQLPDISPPKKSFRGEQVCDTYAVAWIDGPHPNTTEAIVERKVCFSWFRKKCMGDPLNIHIVMNARMFIISRHRLPILLHFPIYISIYLMQCKLSFNMLESSTVCLP